MRILPGLIISLVALAVVFSLIDLRKFGEIIQQADLRFFLLGMLSEVLWLVVRGFVWRTLLRNKASYADAFVKVNEGYLLNNILPFRLGEIGRAFLLGRKANLDFWQVVPSIVIERAIDLAFAAGIILGTIPFVIGIPWATQAAFVTGAIVLLGLVAIYLMARNREFALGLVDKASARWPLVKKLAGQRVEAFFEGLEIIRDGRLFLTAVGWELLDWLVSVLQYYLFIRAFMPSPSLLWVVFALGVGALGIAAPSSPGAVGVFEIAFVGAMAAFGVDASTSTAMALSIHFSSYLATGLIGGFGLYKDGESLSSLYTRLGKMKSEGEPPKAG